MRTPKLEEAGYCSKCCDWFELTANNSLPIHQKKDGEGECSNSHYSPSRNKYLIRTSEDARIVAEFIRDDVGGCLDHGFVNLDDRLPKRHSINCGDGDKCDAKRLQFAQALATFYLEGRLERMDEKRLYESGVQLAKVAQRRLDAVHRMMLGMKHELERQGFYPQLGEVLHALWRHAWFTLDPTTLPIPFLPLNEVPSGSGHLKP